MRQRFSAATAAALLKGRDSIALGSRDGSSLIRYSWSQEGSNGNRCWTARLRSASWIRITSPSLTFTCLDLCFMFSLSLRDFRYCTPHSTDSIKPLYTSVDTSLSSSSQHPLILCFLLGQDLVDRTSWHMESKTGSWASSSRYDRGRLFNATSTSSKTSSSSFHVSWPILLYYGHFKTPISLWNCPPPTRGLCLDKIATLFPDEQGSSEAVHVLPPHSTTSLRQRNFARYTNKSSWGGLFSWWTIWDTGWTPQLFGLAATPGGQLWLSCKQITNYMLFLFFFFVVSLYPIGPAKSRPSTWKEAYPSVLSVGNFPAGGFEKVVTWNFLHP